MMPGDTGPADDHDEMQSSQPSQPLPDDGGAADLIDEIERVQADTQRIDSDRAEDDLTLAEVLGAFWRAPRTTLRLLAESGSVGAAGGGAPVTAGSTAEGARSRAAAAPSGGALQPGALSRRWLPLVIPALAFVAVIPVALVLVLRSLGSGDLFALLLFSAIGVSGVVGALAAFKSALYPTAAGKLHERLRLTLDARARSWLVLGLWAAAFVTAVVGGVTFVSGDVRTESLQLPNGAPLMLAAMLTWLVGEFLLSWPALRRRPNAEARQVDEALRADLGDAERPMEIQPAPLFNLKAVHPLRIYAALGVFVFSLVTWFATADNQFRPAGFYAWVVSIVCVIIMAAPPTWRPARVWQTLSEWNARRIERRRAAVGRFHLHWLVAALLVAFTVGAVFRLYDLPGMPPQMTSDHKEKLLDAQRVLEGDRDVFFMNNGGREGFQMYAMALFSQLPGQDMDHESLKLLAVIESLITLPAMFWLGRQIVGPEDRRRGNLLGLLLVALLAVSYWHLAITRLALRIVLTPLVTALLLGFLIRGLRFNRRGDFVAAGLVLGFGLYMYQAIRMLPVVVVVALVLAGLATLRRGREFWRYMFHLGVVVLVSFVIFVPLMRFSYDYPESFWMRSAGRLFGDDVIQDTDAEGNIIMRDPTLEEQLDAFGENLSTLAGNIRNALLMFNWRGDEAWINGLSFHPQMDPFTGGLFVLGVVACGAMFIRRRDPVYIFIPVVLFIMLLPSALSIAMPDENPSATRTSGAIPPAFILAALPLLLVIGRLRVVLPERTAAWAGGALVTVIVGAALALNWGTYYDDYREKYRFSTWPYSIPGEVLQGFAMSDGAYGNAFMIGYNNWWDYTIIGIEAGAMDWPNGIVNIENVPRQMADLAFCPRVPHRFEPNRDLLFFYFWDDLATEERLLSWFPNGYVKRITTYNSPTYDFKILRVPALGEDNFRAFIAANVVDPVCPPPPPDPLALPAG